MWEARGVVLPSPAKVSRAPRFRDTTRPPSQGCSYLLISSDQGQDSERTIEGLEKGLGPQPTSLLADPLSSPCQGVLGGLRSLLFPLGVQWGWAGAQGQGR